MTGSAPEYPPHTGLYDAPPSYESLSNMSGTKPVMPSRHVPPPFEYQVSQVNIFQVTCYFVPFYFIVAVV